MIPVSLMAGLGGQESLDSKKGVEKRIFLSKICRFR
jgi:hypothetical protein